MGRAARQSTGERLRVRVRDLRERRRLSQSELSARLANLGVTIHPTAIAKLESGARAVTVDEVLALSYALNISPTNLLLPADDDAVIEITPRAPYTALWVRSWIAGLAALPQGKTEAEALARHAEFIAEAPEREQRADRAARHPLLRAIDALTVFARDGALATAGEPSENEAFEGPVAAEALRDAAQRVLAHANLLADELETVEGVRRGKR